MKSLFAVLAVMLALPGSAFARLDDPQVSSNSLGASPALATPRAPSTVRVQAPGTDVAAPDQQSPKPVPAQVHVSTPAAGFDWGTAAIGAATGLVVMSALLGLALTIRRRHSIAAS